MTMESASIGVSSLTRMMTSSSPTKNDGYWFLKMSSTVDTMTPISVDVITATTSENLAVLGWFAPNSFDTLTLHQFEIISNVYILRSYRLESSMEFLFLFVHCVKDTWFYLTAVFIPIATMAVHPKMFMLQFQFILKIIRCIDSKNHRFY